MSFQTLNKEILNQAADEFGIAWSTESPTKAQMLKDLQEEGITWSMYKEVFPDIDEEDDESAEEEVRAVIADDSTEDFKQADEQVIVKMTRENGTYEVRNYVFTRSHPFMPVSAGDADYLVHVLGGFSVATPREVEEYYS